MQPGCFNIWHHHHLHSAQEAVLLADRIVVVSAGPERIDSDWDLPT
jgi:ABC-type nitrate/sulfonate/bicarbonate transport system ATPase subunit